MENYFFTQVGKRFYGQRFGWAIQYKINTRNHSGVPSIRILEGMLPPDDIYMPYTNKIDLVSELLHLLAQKYGTVKVFLYHHSLLLKDEMNSSEIKTLIRQRQRKFIKISMDAPRMVASELEANLEVVLNKIDIFS